MKLSGLKPGVSIRPAKSRPWLSAVFRLRFWGGGIKGSMGEKKGPSLIIPTILLLDAIAIITSDLASFIIRFDGRFPTSNFNAYLELLPFIIMLRLGSFYVFHLYDKPKYKSNFVIFINIIKANTASSIVIVFMAYFLAITAYPRSIIAASWILTTVFIASWRFVLKDFVGLYLGKDFFRIRLLIIGTSNHAHDAAFHAMRDAGVNYRLLGFIDTGTDLSANLKKSEIVGSLEDMLSIIKKYSVDEIILADPALENERIERLMRILTPKKIALKSIPATYETVISNTVLHEHDIPLSGPAIFGKPASWYWGLKRLIDIAASAILLVITFPVLLTAVILIKITSPGPVFYLQKRTGLNGRSFVMYKLRTMHINAEKGKIPRWAKRNDVRITPAGRILRHLRIDELPQLFNVLKNEMSLAGPRPERPYFASKLIRKIPFYAERLQVKPGITGWAQVNFRYAATEEDSEKKLVYDLFYIQNMSFSLDFLIALKTLKVVLTGRGAH